MNEDHKAILESIHVSVEEEIRVKRFTVSNLPSKDEDYVRERLKLWAASERMELVGEPVLFWLTTTNGSLTVNVRWQIRKMDTPDFTVIALIAITQGFQALKDFHEHTPLNEFELRKAAQLITEGGYKDLASKLTKWW